MGQSLRLSTKTAGNFLESGHTHKVSGKNNHLWHSTNYHKKVGFLDTKCCITLECLIQKLKGKARNVQEE